MGNLGKAADFSVHSWIQSKWISFTIRENTHTHRVSIMPGENSMLNYTTVVRTQWK